MTHGTKPCFFFVYQAGLPCTMQHSLSQEEEVVFGMACEAEHRLVLRFESKQELYWWWQHDPWQHAVSRPWLAAHRGRNCLILYIYILTITNIIHCKQHFVDVAIIDSMLSPLRQG